MAHAETEGDETVTPPDSGRPSGSDPPAPGGSGPWRPRSVVRRYVATVGITGAALSALALVTAGVPSAASVAAGAAIATANLWVLARIVMALLPVDGAHARAQSRAAWVLVGLLKMTVLVAVLWAALRHGAVSPLAFALGMGALPIGIAIGSLVSDRSGQSKERLQP